MKGHLSNVGLPIGCLWSLVTMASVAAAECPLERAVFVEPEAGYVLRFQAIGSDAATVGHMFTIVMPSSGIALDGHTVHDDDAARLSGMIFNNCPEGDATGDELRACTLWQGYVYNADTQTASIDLLGPEGSDAPDRILIPGFGPAIRYSPLWTTNSLSAVPWDVFEFKSCAL